VKQSARCPSASRNRERGFTLVETTVVAAIPPLLVSLASPSYLEARYEPALDEANFMAIQWRTLVGGCCLQTPDVTALGVRERPGRYWDWTSDSATYTVGSGRRSERNQDRGNGNGVGNGQGTCRHDSGTGNNNGQDNGYDTGGTCGNSGTSRGAMQSAMSWLSRYAGLEPGAAYLVTLFEHGSTQGQSSVSCSPRC